MSYRSLVTVRRAYIAVGVLLPLPIPLAVCRALYSFNIAVNVTSAFYLLFCLVITSVAYFKVFRIIRTSATNPLERIGPKRYSTSNPHDQVQKKICLHHSLSIVAIFVISFSPMAIFSSVLIPVLIYKKEVVPLYNASVILLFISSSLNPGLYLWRMTCTYSKWSFVRLLRAMSCKPNEY